MKVDRDKENIDSDFFLHYLTTCLIPCMGKFAKGEENSILRRITEFSLNSVWPEVFTIISYCY